MLLRSCVTTPIPPPPTDVPGAPEGPLKYANITKSSCTIGWKPPKDNGGADITHYLVEKMDADTFRWVPVGDTTKCQLKWVARKPAIE